MEALLTIAEAAARLGVCVDVIQDARRAGLIDGARKGYTANGGRWQWLLPVAWVAGLRRDSAGRVIWKPLEERERPGFRPGRAKPEPLPRCDLCGIVLERDGIEDENGLVIHAADSPDAGRCWMCRKEYGEKEARA